MTISTTGVNVTRIERPSPTAHGRGLVPSCRRGAGGSPTFSPNTSNQFGVAPSIINRPYTITAEIEVPKGGANGVLVTQGGRFSGYGLYLVKGKPTFTMNLLDLERPKWQSQTPLTPGKHTIVFDWKTAPTGEPIGRGGSGTLSVDGRMVAQKALPHTQPMIWAWDETFDIGLDTGTSVDNTDYDVPFPFTGTIGKITFDLGETLMSPEAIKKMMEEMAQKRDR